MGDNTVYDYATIEQCNSAITKGVSEMHDIAENFEQEVKKLVADTWGGTAADGYQRAADSIQTSMQEKSEILQKLGKTNASNADLMSDIDKKGQTLFDNVG